MKRPSKILLSGLAAFGLTASTFGLTIVPTFDSSITNSPNASAMIAAINRAIQVFQTNIVDNQTVYINYVSDSTVGLGQSSTWGNTYLYSDYLTALRNKATSANDTNGLHKLTNNNVDPLVGSSQIYMNLPLAVLMGLDSGTGPDGFDATIYLNTSIMNFTRPPGNHSKYDMQQVTEHEMDEVLGTPSNLPDTTMVSPIDLFRYTTNLVRTYTTSGDNSYFSVDGTNLLARFNMDSGGDYADWYSVSVNWAPPGQTPHPQVQDAFTPPNTALDLGTNELAMLDVIGWTLAANVPPPPVLKIVNSGATKVTLSWSNNVSGFVLQERTNLTTGLWSNSTSGSTNPVVVTAAGTRKFYRLYKAATPSVAMVETAAVQPKRTNPLRLVTRVSLPQKP